MHGYSDRSDRRRATECPLYKLIFLIKPPPAFCLNGPLLSSSFSNMDFISGQLISLTNPIHYDSRSICKQNFSKILMDSDVNLFLFIQILIRGYVKDSLVAFYCKLLFKTIPEKDFCD